MQDEVSGASVRLLDADRSRARRRMHRKRPSKRTGSCMGHRHGRDEPRGLLAGVPVGSSGTGEGDEKRRRADMARRRRRELEAG